MTTYGNEQKLEALDQNYIKIYLYPGQSVKKYRSLPSKDNSFFPVSPYSLVTPERSLRYCGNFTGIEGAINKKFPVDDCPNYFLLTAKTDNQNAELSKLAEQNPDYIIFQVSGRNCDIVTSIYKEFYVSFYNLLTRLTYNLFQQINKNSLFMIVFDQLNKDYVTTSAKIANSLQKEDNANSLQKEDHANPLQTAFYNILEKCINIYLII